MLNLEFSMRQDSAEERNARRPELLQLNLDDVDRARARLMVEEGTQDVLAAGERLWQAYSMYRLSIERPASGMTGAEVIAERKELHESAEELVARTRAHLAALSERSRQPAQGGHSRASVGVLPRAR